MWELSHGSHDPPQLPRKATLVCAECSTSRTVQYSKLLSTKGWRRLWCAGTCRRAWMTKKWRCACEIPWHQCPLHAQGDYTTLNKRTTTKTAQQQHLQPTLCPTPAQKPARPRPQPAASTNTMLTHGTASTKRAKCTPLMPKLNMHEKTQPPAASTTPHDMTTPITTKRKADGVNAVPAGNTRVKPSGPDSLPPPPPTPGVSQPRSQQRSGDGPPFSFTPAGNQGQKRVAALLPAIFAKSAKLAGKFAHLT